MIRILLILFVKNNEQYHLIISNDIPTAFFLKLKMRHSKQSWKKLHHFKKEDF